MRARRSHLPARGLDQPQNTLIGASRCFQATFPASTVYRFSGEAVKRPPLAPARRYS